ncbi:Glycosyltransferase, catalytic subunit of cellulose synthase and poly-beta-1,6-N-acetylglucosamine synthase [Cnuella takakiae]|uniref:Glycosyltransferase, catalytic subunit of cellulose synthase and poly-beta-1,6-N-acetylglucosamine synthase n=1 Tax=Cnuella takakiae TaxID=1302690 RepID=A0A1M5ERH6_9BACT|nr:glycosyltransferase [Cnuella takakiae]SHF81612.1 Glycosyltransferase, catalytic subunit of cellulose synthase and poly-beta-1,6-N-acetylglucosamine synthase [Cnuella takakiae]
MYELLKSFAYLVFVLYALSSLWLLINGLMQLHLLWHYKRGKKRAAAIQQMPAVLPFVSIQIPVYNERYVIGRLLQSLAGLDYPKDRFELQVLDDSTDDSQGIIDAEVAWLQQQDIQVSVLRRKDRKGFKAGALQAGLPLCKGELIAIFDADFTPPPNFLKRLITHFNNPKIGLVQARWGHINEYENALTRIQTFMLDTHFSIEQSGRYHAGYFINFCGTAGIWRKQCIEEAGGWDGSVLSEDLDLSYRAQLKGWKLVYDQDTEVPAELPAAIEAYKVQQFRWTKGTAQIFRKNLSLLLQTAMPLSKKIHGIFHLLSSFMFVALFFNALLTVPMLVFRNMYPEIEQLSRYTVVASLNLFVITFFYYTGKRALSKEPATFLRHYPLFLVVNMGMAAQNCCAVLQGLFSKKAVFVRTPKSNSNTQNVYLSQRISWLTLFEIALLLYYLGGVVLSIYFNDFFLMGFFFMVISGLAFIIFHSLAQTKPMLQLKARFS